jgi:hypothetical protein
VCGFSAKGPWCVVVDGVPYGAYTENQARLVAGIIKQHHNAKQVMYFKMLKFDDAAEDYSDAILMALRPLDKGDG